MDLMQRRRELMMMGKAEDIYKDMVTFEFALSESVTKPITDQVTNLAKVVVDGVEIPNLVDGMTYNFAVGSHKVGWLPLDKTYLYYRTIPQVRHNSDAMFSDMVVNVPSCIEQIAAYALRGFPCQYPTRLYFHRTTPPTLLSSASVGLVGNGRVYVPVGTIEAYKSAPNYSAGWFGGEF